MHPQELWWLVEAKRPQKRYGSLTEGDLAELVRDLKGMGLAKHG